MVEKFPADDAALSCLVHACKEVGQMERVTAILHSNVVCGAECPFSLCLVYPPLPRCYAVLHALAWL